MLQNKTLPFYLAAAALFILLKFGYTFTGTGDLLFLLKPTNVLISMATGEQFRYIPGSGYLYPGLNLLIERSCSGFNFWLICFVMLAWLFIRFSSGMKSRLLALPLTLFCAYVFTIFVNASRIVVSVFIQHTGGAFVAKYYGSIHEAEGILIYLTFLILIYLAFEQALKKLNPGHAQLT